MALPLYDSQPARRVPWVTYLLVAANVVVFLLTPMSNFATWYGEDRVRECRAAHFTYEYGAVPKELTTGDQQPLPNDIVRECGPASFEKAPWTSAFTSMFLHSGALHLLGNLVALFVVGMGVEDRLGRWRYLLSYLAFGLVAVYGFAWTSARPHRQLGTARHRRPAARLGGAGILVRPAMAVTGRREEQRRLHRPHLRLRGRRRLRPPRPPSRPRPPPGRAEPRLTRAR